MVIYKKKLYFKNEDQVLSTNNTIKKNIYMYTIYLVSIIHTNLNNMSFSCYIYVLYVLLSFTLRLSVRSRLLLDKYLMNKVHIALSEHLIKN